MQLVKKGAIYTTDSKNPQAQTIAITGKYLSHVGANDGVQPFDGDTTQVIDLRQQVLLTGFVESRIHPMLTLFAEGANSSIAMKVESKLLGSTRWR